MNADGFVLEERLHNATGAARDQLIKEIDRCAWYATMDRKVYETQLAILMKKDKINYETLSVFLLSWILDELT